MTSKDTGTALAASQSNLPIFHLNHGSQCKLADDVSFQYHLMIQWPHGIGGIISIQTFAVIGSIGFKHFHVSSFSSDFRLCA